MVLYSINKSRRLHSKCCLMLMLKQYSIDIVLTRLVIGSVGTRIVRKTYPNAECTSTVKRSAAHPADCYGGGTVEGMDVG